MLEHLHVLVDIFIVKDVLVDFAEDFHEDVAQHPYIFEIEQVAHFVHDFFTLFDYILAPQMLGRVRLCTPILLDYLVDGVAYSLTRYNGLLDLFWTSLPSEFILQELFFLGDPDQLATIVSYVF